MIIERANLLYKSQSNYQENHKLTEKWFDCFMKPTLTGRVAEVLSCERAIAVNQRLVDEFFNIVQKEYEKVEKIFCDLVLGRDRIRN